MFFRYSYFTPIMLVLFIVFNQKECLLKIKYFGKWGYLTALINGLQQFTYALAVQNTAAANALVILACNSLFAALISYVVLREIIPWRTILCCCFCFGAILLIFASSISTHQTLWSVLGEFFALLCSIFTASYFVMLRFTAIKQG